MLRENDSSSFVSLVVLPPLQPWERCTQVLVELLLYKCDELLQGEAFVEVFSVFQSCGHRTCTVTHGQYVNSRKDYLLCKHRDACVTLLEEGTLGPCINGFRMHRLTCWKCFGVRSSLHYTSCPTGLPIQKLQAGR